MTTHEFRAGFEFDVDALTEYLASKVAGFGGPIRVRQLLLELMF